MEDHLKNKNRLEKEWEALCAYQAEPNSSLVAQREENMPKNRCPAVLTCTYSARELRAGGGAHELSVGTGCTCLFPHHFSADVLKGWKALPRSSPPGALSTSKLSSHFETGVLITPVRPSQPENRESVSSFVVQWHSPETTGETYSRSEYLLCLLLLCDFRLPS